MSMHAVGLSIELREYILEKSLREPKIMQRLRQDNAKHPEAHMQIAQEQGQFITMLLRLMKAKQALELGVYMGYSSLAIAFGLPPDGKLVACEINEEYANTAKKYWIEAGVDDKIDLRIAPGLDTMNELLTQGFAGTFDFVFIDGDKRNYSTYYELALKLLRHGGIVAIDNVLWYGRILDSSNKEEITQAIRELNSKLSMDERVFLSMLPLGDGMSLAMKI